MERWLLVSFRSRSRPTGGLSLLGGVRCLCAHDKCASGDQLDSASDVCVTAICAVDADCCSSGRDADCVAAVAGVCGLNCD